MQNIKVLHTWGDQHNGTYCNPILNADYSDPDIVRYKDKYYMISSTFHLYPSMVILESSDLINWKTVNYAFENMTELDPEFNWDRMNRYNHGIYAGSLRYLEWKERDESGNLVEKSKWFMHSTLFATGIVVSTADSVYGPWICQYMKDINGKDLKVPKWDDNCPYWEFNEDGTLKEAYMIASKCNGAWYNHIFKMSLDGTQLLDGNVEFMSIEGDTTRKRTGKTPDNQIFANYNSGDPKSNIIDKFSNEIIPTVTNLENTHSVEMNEHGDISSIINATHIPNREGTVITDIFSAEAAKIISFDKKTIIGNTTFNGRHGNNEKISDYVYIFNSEYWDGFRMPLMRRAKSIYGDKFDSNGNYIGAGTSSDPGCYEVQRICVNIYTPHNTFEPNQGGYVDIPPEMATDGREHWYWMTHHGETCGTPQCRPVSLLPVTWVEGWPLVGEVDGQECKGKPDKNATPYDGTGLEGNTNNEIHHPNQKYKPGIMQWICPKPPIKGKHTAYKFQDSDNFGEGENGGQQNSTKDKLSPNWQWNYVPRKGFWSLSQRLAQLRLYAFSTVDKSENFFKIGNTLCQKYVASDNVLAEIKMDISNMKNGQEAGLVHFNGGVNYNCIAVKQDEKGIRRLSYCHNMSNVKIKTETIILRSIVDENRINTYQFSIDDGKTFEKFGENYTIKQGGYRSDLIGIYTFNNNETDLPKDYVPNETYAFGYVDIEYFKYKY